MHGKTLFGRLLCHTYRASGTTEPLERFYASMFADFFNAMDIQPCCSTVRRILTGKLLVPRKILQHYRDPSNPRCPRKLEQDLTSLADTCFVDRHRRTALRNCLTVYLENLPNADWEDLIKEIPDDDLIGLWTRLTWYALCGDHHE